nr:Predicted ATPase (AAA+ superfamily) [Streptococcus thermophilus]
MDPIDNPYTPNAGARPPLMAGRGDLLSNFDVLLARLSKGRAEQSMIITGLRGVGKTVLLGEFRRKAEKAGWVTIEIEASKHDDTHFRSEIYHKVRPAILEISPKKKWGRRARRAAGVIKSFGLTVDPSGNLTASFDVDPEEGVADTSILSYDLTDLFVSLGEAASEHDTGVVLLIDEVQFLQTSQLEALIAALHKTVQLQLPITMVGAGLPQIAELAGDAKSYAERLLKFPEIGHLDSDAARSALSSPAAEEGVSYTDEALDLAEEITGGYPYFIQEIGASIWTVAEKSPITFEDVREAEDGYLAKLDSSFFRVRLDRATPLQSAYMRAMAGLGPEPQKASEVAAAMGRESPEISPTRAELINMGLLYTPDHGYAAFTVPHFDKYMLRAIPVLEVPPKQRRGKRNAQADES